MLPSCDYFVGSERITYRRLVAVGRHGSTRYRVDLGVVAVNLADELRVEGFLLTVRAESLGLCLLCRDDVDYLTVIRDTSFDINIFV